MPYVITPQNTGMVPSVFPVPLCGWEFPSLGRGMVGEDTLDTLMRAEAAEGAGFHAMLYFIILGSSPSFLRKRYFQNKKPS